MSDPATPLPSRAVTPAALAKWRDTVQAAVMDIGQVRLELAAKNPAGLNTPEDDSLIKTQEALRQVSGDLHQIAPPTGTLPGGDIDLFQLDTPETRELLSLLERAQAVAERVDGARGRSLDASIPLAPGESRGCDLAEQVSYIAMRVRGEVHGAKGNGLE